MPELVTESSDAGGKVQRQEEEKTYENPGNVIRWRYTGKDGSGVGGREDIPEFELGVRNPSQQRKVKSKDDAGG